MTAEFFASTAATNVLLAVLVVVLASIGLLGRSRKSPPVPNLRQRADLVGTFAAPSNTPEDDVHRWLIAEVALLARLASEFGVPLLEESDPAWQWIREQKLEELAMRDPSFLQRIKNKFLSLPPGVQNFLIELLKKLNGAIAPALLPSGAAQRK